MDTTPAFVSRVQQLADEFWTHGQTGEMVEFSLALERCLQKTDEDHKRWPVYDKRAGVWSYRAVVGTFDLDGKPQQYVLFYERRENDKGQLEPLFIWAERTEP